jgi:non-heme chloroperoxidase
MDRITVRVDDSQPIYLWRTGHGRPLILLHEWAADHSAWDRFIPALANSFTVHLWDARGHGATGATPAPQAAPSTVERMARDLKQVIDHLGLEAPLLVGHSMGALTLWQYIALYGCRGLGGLCIIDQSPKLVTTADWRLGIYGDFPESRNRAFLAETGRGRQQPARSRADHCRRTRYPAAPRTLGPPRPGSPDYVLE